METFLFEAYLFFVHLAMGALILLLAFSLMWFVFRVFAPKKWPPMVCATCGHYGPPKSAVRGSLALEIVLWLFLLLPGLIYSMWRVASRHKSCAECGAVTLVTPGSPVGKRMLTAAEALHP